MKKTAKEMKKKIIYFLIGALGVFAFFITSFILFDVIMYGKAEINSLDVIIIGCISLILFVIILVRRLRKYKEEMIHRKGESWKD